MTFKVLVLICVVGAVTLFVRILPFLFFKKKGIPKLIRYLEGYMPPMVMIILVMYSIRNVQWGRFPHGIPVIAGMIVVTILHLWKKNSLLSIFGGTIFYMFVVQTELMAKVVLVLPF